MTTISSLLKSDNGQERPTDVYQASGYPQRILSKSNVQFFFSGIAGLVVMLY